MTKIDSSLARKYFVEKADEVRFLDPVLGVELKANEPPPSLFHNELTSRGIKHLQTLAAEKRLTIQLVQSVHAGAEDFLDVEREFGDILRRAPAVGVETWWRPKRKSTALPTLSSIDYRFASSAQWRAFQQEQLSWLSKQGKQVLPCEYADPSGYDNELSQRLEEIVDLCEQANDQGDKQAYTCLYGCYQTTRQWVFITHLGYWLWHLEQKKQLPQGELKIPLMSGSGHISVERKINAYFGIPTEYYVVSKRTLGPLPKSAQAEFVPDMTAQARVTYEQLASLSTH